MSIASVTKKIRRQQDLSQEKFGETLGVTKQAVSLWETGNAVPSYSFLIAQAVSNQDWRRDWALNCLDNHPEAPVRMSVSQNTEA